jgi:hypothetical protein
MVFSRQYIRSRCAGCSCACSLLVSTAGVPFGWFHVSSVSAYTSASYSEPQVPHTTSNCPNLMSLSLLVFLVRRFHLVTLLILFHVRSLPFPSIPRALVLSLFTIRRIILMLVVKLLLHPLLLLSRNLRNWPFHRLTLQK